MPKIKHSDYWDVAFLRVLKRLLPKHNELWNDKQKIYFDKNTFETSRPK